MIYFSILCSADQAADVKPIVLDESSISTLLKINM